MNTQPISKKVESNGAKLQVHSIFNTIQGEGPFTGTPAVFIRLAGCNLQCPMCDTDYTTGATEIFIQDIVDSVIAFEQKSKFVVITGGEPFRQNISRLCSSLLDLEYFVQVETNGTLAPTIDTMDMERDISQRSGVYIVCSPKTKVNPVIQKKACAYKYILSHRSINLKDGLPVTALDHTVNSQVFRPDPNCSNAYLDPALIYLQPADEQDKRINELNLQACINSCMRHGYILQLQLHKLIGVE